MFVEITIPSCVGSWERNVATLKLRIRSRYHCCPKFGATVTFLEVWRSKAINNKLKGNFRSVFISLSDSFETVWHLF